MATRFRLGQNATVLAAPVSPAFSAEWAAASADRRRMAPYKEPDLGAVDTGATTKTISEGSASAINVLFRQYLSRELAGAQTIGGTLSGAILAIESSTSADAQLQIAARVVSGDGTVERGVLLPVRDLTLTAELGTAYVGMAIPHDAPLTLTSVSAQDGDRIVVEVGARFLNTVTTSFSASLRFMQNEDSATDITVGSADNWSPWVEFSQDIALRTPISITAAATDGQGTVVLGGEPAVVTLALPLTAAAASLVLDGVATRAGLDVPVAQPPGQLAALPAPAAPTLTTTSATSTLAAGTYDYVVSAWQVDVIYETQGSPVSTITITEGQTVHLSWPDVTGAHGYRVYRRKHGAGWVLAKEVRV